MKKSDRHFLSLFTVHDFFYKIDALKCITVTVLNKELGLLHSRKSLGTINQLEEYFNSYFPRFWLSSVLSPRYYNVHWRNESFTLAERIMFLKCLILKKYYYKLDSNTIKWYNKKIVYIRSHQKIIYGQIKDPETGKYKKIRLKSAFNIFKVAIDDKDAL